MHLNYNFIQDGESSKATCNGTLKAVLSDALYVYININEEGILKKFKCKQKKNIYTLLHDLKGKEVKIENGILTVLEN